MSIGATRLHTRRPVFALPTDDADTYSDGIDWIAVERATQGEYNGRDLTENELREAALFLRRHDVSRVAISIQLSVYERLVKEWEAEAGLLDADDLCTKPGCGRARPGTGLCALCLSQHRIQEKHWRAAVAELGVAA